MPKPGREPQNKQEKSPQKRHFTQTEAEESSRHTNETEIPVLGNTPFIPPTNKHIAMLSADRPFLERKKVLSQLQRSYGNQYVQRLMSSIGLQAKLTVNPPNDIYEQEADRVADTVSRKINLQVQRQAEEEEPIQGKSIQRQAEEEEELIQGKPIQRQANEEEEEVQTKSVLQRQPEEEEEQIQGKFILQKQDLSGDPAYAWRGPRAREWTEYDRLLKIMRNKYPDMAMEIVDKDEFQQPTAWHITLVPGFNAEELDRSKILNWMARLTGETVRTPSESEASSRGLPSTPETSVMEKPVMRETVEPIVSNDVEKQISSARGSGAPLDESLRTVMEPQFGADFSRVRVHTDNVSGTLNDSLQARAFTTGQDIFFGNGQYQPQTQEGKKLIAHELTHTVQQSGIGRKIQRWGPLYGGTPHSEVTNKALDELGPRLKYINWDVRKYLVEHADDMDVRVGGLVGSYGLGKAYEAWGNMVQKFRSVKKEVGGMAREAGLLTRRGIGFLGESLGISEGKYTEEEAKQKQEEENAPEKGIIGKGLDWIKSGAKKTWRGLRRGVGFVGEKLGLTEEGLKAKETKESQRLREEEEEITKKAADEYDNNRFYWRSPTEAPNHAEAGMYREDGMDKDQQRVKAYLDNAVDAWKADNRTQALMTLSLGLHVAEDRGSHGDGKPNTGHDPRLSNPPPPGAKIKYYDDYVKKTGKPDTGHDCDIKSKNPDGFSKAVDYAKEMLSSFVDRIIAGDDKKKKQEEEKLGSYKQPAWYKRGARAIGTFFGKDVIR
jgi:hypothetical protein